MYWQDKGDYLCVQVERVAKVGSVNGSEKSFIIIIIILMEHLLNQSFPLYRTRSCSPISNCFICVSALFPAMC